MSWSARLALLCAISFVPFAHAAGRSAGDGASTHRLRTIKAAYVNSLSYSPLFLALAKGYLRNEGIDLELHLVTSVSDTVAFLGFGNMDVAFGNIGVPLFNAAGRDLDVKIVAGMSYYPGTPGTLSPCPLLVGWKLSQTGAVKSVVDLKGRTVAFNTRGGIIEYLMAESLKRAGLTLSDIHIVTMPFPDMATALSNGAIDAALMPEPAATAARKKKLAALLDPNPAPGALATVVLFGKTMLAPENASVARGILKALRRAGNELQTPEQIMSPDNVTIWAKYTEVPPSLIKETAPYVFKKNLGLDLKNLESQEAYLVATHQIREPLPIERLVSTSFAALAEKDGPGADLPTTAASVGHQP